jgi:hypothetical protein
MFIVSFAVQKLFNLMQSHLSILAIISWATGVPRPLSYSLKKTCLDNSHDLQEIVPEKFRNLPLQCGSVLNAIYYAAIQNLKIAKFRH